MSVKMLLFDPDKHIVLFVGIQTNNSDTDQTLQNVSSNQGVHCLLADCSIKN